MNHQFTCPQCNKLLRVGPGAGEYLTCPRCLAPVENPAFALATAAPTQPAPIPVIPIADEDVRTDLADTSRLMIIVGIILIAAAIASLAYVWDAGIAVPAAVIGFVLLLGGIFFRAPSRRGPTRDNTYYPEPAERHGDVLEYELRRPRAQRTMAIGAQVALGFVTWIAAVIATVAMLQSRPFRTAGSGGVFFSIIVVVSLLFALAAWVRARLEWRGFVPGLLIGFGITCLVPVGIVVVICGHP